MPNRVSNRKERFWQVTFLIIYVFIIVFGFFTDRVESRYLRSTRIFWTMGLPLAPFFMVIFGYYVWRRLCPLSFFAKIASLLPRKKQRRVPPWMEKWSYLVIFSVMFFSLWTRLIFTNGSSSLMATFMALLSLSAFIIGLVFTGKSWCNFFCPVAIIEKVYLEPTGMGQGIRADNSQCKKCTACKKNCPDIDVEIGYWKEKDLLSRRVATYAWPGLVFAFYFAYWTYKGTWEYYFSGVWTREPDEWKNAFAQGFFFLQGTKLYVPKVVAMFLSLLVPSALSCGLFFGLEKLLTKRLGKERATHYCLSFAAFAAFNFFYFFAGAPTWREVPFGPRLIASVAVALSTWFLVKRLPRREDEAVQEKFAKRFVARWNFEEKPPEDLREAFFMIKRKEGEKEKGLKVYGDTVRELMAEGVVTRTELKVLEQVRAQFNITDADHEKVLKQLAITDRRLFDQSAAMSAEERLQEQGYRIALRNMLVRGATKRDVEDLRRDYDITPEAHQRIVGEMTGSQSGLTEQADDLLTRIEDLRAVHRKLYAFLIGPSFEFLSMVMLKRQDRLVDHVLDVLSMLGQADVVRHNRSQLFEQDKVSRRTAIDALRSAGEEGQPVIMDRLIPVLEERVPQPDMKTTVSELQQDQVLDALSCDPDPYLRAGAMLASALPGDALRPAGLERILNGLTDEDSLVREAALQALPVNWAGAAQAVNTLLVDKDPAVRSAAQAALLRRADGTLRSVTGSGGSFLGAQPGSGMMAALHLQGMGPLTMAPSSASAASREVSRSRSGMEAVAEFDRNVHSSFGSPAAGTNGGFGPGDTVVTGRFAVPRLPQNLGPVCTNLERVLFLHCVPLFVDFEPEDLLMLARSSEEKTLTEGQKLFSQGDLGDEVYVLISGRVQISMATGQRPQILSVLGPGDCIGEMSVIDGSPRSATATVVGPAQSARLLCIAGDTFRRFLEERSHVAGKVIGVLASRLRQLVERAHAPVGPGGAPLPRIGSNPPR